MKGCSINAPISKVTTNPYYKVQKVTMLVERSGITDTDLTLTEPCYEKTGLRGFRPGHTQIVLYSQRRWLEA